MCFPHRPPCVAALLGALLAVFLRTLPTPAAAAPQADLGEPISVALRDADLSTVLGSLAQIAGATLDLDPQISGLVTVEADALPWKQVADDICRGHDLACFWTGGHGPLLTVRRSHGFAGLADPISMSLRRASAREVLMVFDQIAGEQVLIEVDPQIDGAVDLQLQRVPWPVAIEHVCDQVGCVIDWSPDALDEPSSSSGATARRIQIRASGAPSRTYAVDSRGVPALRILTGLLDHPQLESFRPIRLEASAGLPSSVDLETSPGSYAATLDALCEIADCTWALRWGTPSLLLVHAKEDVYDEAATAASLDPGPQKGLPPTKLRASLRSASGLETTRDLEMTWNRPVHHLALADEDETRTWLHLSWIPFGPDRQVVLPTLVRCTDDASSRITPMAPLLLPFEAAGWSHSDDGLLVDLRQASGAGDGRTTADAEPPTSQATAKPCAEPQVQLLARLEELGDSDSTDVSTGDRGTPRESRFLLDTRPGAYLMVRTPSDTSTGGSQAVVVLGVDQDGKTVLGIVRSGLSGSSAGAPSLEPLRLGGRQSYAEELPTDGTGPRYLLEIQSLGRKPPTSTD